MQCARVGVLDRACAQEGHAVGSNLVITLFFALLKDGFGGWCNWLGGGLSNNKMWRCN